NFTHSGIFINGQCPQDTVGHNRIEKNVIEGTPTAILVVGANNLQNALSANTLSRPAPSADSAPAALIDLGGDGPAPNDAGDADMGPNTLINFPDVLTVTAQDATVTATGKLNSLPAGGATVEIFGVNAFRVVGTHVVVDGVVFLGRTTIDANGNFTAA